MYYYNSDDDDGAEDDDETVALSKCYFKNKSATRRHFTVDLTLNFQTSSLERAKRCSGTECRFDACEYKLTN